MSNIVDRQNAEALIQEQLENTIQQDAPSQSVFMALARRLPNMTSKQTRIPVLDMLPMAYWVNGETGYKQTSSQAWDNVYLTAEELAVIVPIPETVLADASFDILGEIQPRVVEAIGKRVDEAVIFGVNRPATWPADIITRARQAGNNVSSAGVANGDYYELLLGENGVISKVEKSGRMVTGVIAGMPMRGKLRGIKSNDGIPLFKADMQGATQYALDGAPMYFPDSFNPSIAMLIAGNWSQAVYAIRQDITVKILDQGIIQDPATKEIVYNLAQQDMIALRVVFRMGWALPNPATALDGDRTGCAFAYLEPATPVSTQKVTFTVTDNKNTPVALAGAIVDINGARIKTNSTGNAVFNLRAGTCTAKITKKGYNTMTEDITVADSAVTKAVKMVANE